MEGSLKNSGSSKNEGSVFRLPRRTTDDLLMKTSRRKDEHLVESWTGLIGWT